MSNICQISKIQSSKESSKICHAIITDYKALLCTPQEGAPKVTEGAPYFHYIGAWGPLIYCKIGPGGPHLRGDPINYDSGTGSKAFYATVPAAPGGQQKLPAAGRDILFSPGVQAGV